MTSLLQKKAHAERRRKRLSYTRSIQKKRSRHIWKFHLVASHMDCTQTEEQKLADTRSSEFNPKRIKDCYLNLKSEMALSNFKRSICNVCMELFDPTNLKKLQLTACNTPNFYNLDAELHKQKFGSSNFPSRYSMTHQRHYHVHQLIQVNDHEYLECCDYCSRHLAKGTTLPQFSIPNYFFPEPVPDCLRKLSIAELLMISRVFPRCIIYTLSKDSHANHRFLKGM